jgi:hypothetical protein
MAYPSDIFDNLQCEESPSPHLTPWCPWLLYFIRASKILLYPNLTRLLFIHRSSTLHSS